MPHQQQHEQLTLANCSGKYTKCGHNHVMLIPFIRRVYKDITRVCLSGPATQINTLKEEINYKDPKTQRSLSAISNFID